MANDGSFASPTLKAGESYSYTFQKSGKTTYHDSLAFTVSPTIQTSYQAHWRTTGSPSVTVDVKPRVGFGRLGRLFNVRVTSDLNYSGNYVVVQRKRPYGSWTTAKRVFLNGSSRATFAMRLAKGRSFLRVVLPQGQAGAGYVGNLSRQIIVTR